jgi:hypothetical protein
MRFVKSPKRTASSVTTKGWSGRSHHARKSETPVQFIGVDGEGMTTSGGEHKYVLFGVGEAQIEDSGGLRWSDCFEHLYSQYRPGTAFAGFFLGYDFTQMFRTLPEDRAWMLLTNEGRALRKHKIAGKSPHPVQHEGWQFDILGNKRLRIRPKDCDCEVATCGCKFRPWMYTCDVGSFFQSSFLTVIDPSGWAEGTAVVTPEEFALIKEGKEKRSTAVLDEDMKMYNRLENVVLSRVMTTLDVGFHSIGIHLPASKWFGPGQAAQAWLAKEKVPTREDHSVVPDWFLEAARMSYYGGWFEQFIHGIIPGESHEYDINSAYPSIIATLPCLLHGKYTRGTGLPVTHPGNLCLAYGNVWSPSMPDGTKGQHIGAMLHRDSSGRIFRPAATEGWFWWDELKAAQKAGMIKRLDNKGKQQIRQWVNYEPCDCPPPMANIAGLYQKRLDVGKKSPLGKAAKLIYNSDYGKFAQSIGDPLYGNPVYASRITSGCRTQLLDAIATHPGGMAAVAMVATDAIYFLTPHPGLPVSEKLGEWDYKAKHNLTLFKPGVYWDDETRRQIAEERSPLFKARGFQAADFVTSLARIDSEYRVWERSMKWDWPSVSFTPKFAMTTALQALRRNDWDNAGVVAVSPKAITQDSNPSSKRDGLYRDSYDGRTIYRSSPHLGMSYGEGQMRWVPSHPYEKRFGMEDPWSQESREQFGLTEDGNVTDILAWILTGE